MKKVLIACCIFLSFACIGGIVYGIVPKDTKEELVIEANDVGVKVGETAEIEYSSSISDAVLIWNIKDRNVATVFIEDGVSKISGHQQGLTTLTIKGVYSGMTCEKTINISVVGSSSSSQPIDAPDESEKSEEGPISNPSEEDKTDNTNPALPDETAPTEEDEIALSFTNRNNCTVENKTITISSNKVAMFSVSADINIDTLLIECSDSEVVVNYLQDIGSNTYSLKTQNTGEYTINFVINGKNIEYKLIVI